MFSPEAQRIMDAIRKRQQPLQARIDRLASKAELRRLVEDLNAPAPPTLDDLPANATPEQRQAQERRVKLYCDERERQAAARRKGIPLYALMERLARVERRLGISAPE